MDILVNGKATLISRKNWKLFSTDCTITSDFVVDGYIDASKGISIENGIIRTIEKEAQKINSTTKRTPLMDDAIDRIEIMLTDGHKLYKVAPKIGPDKAWSDIYSFCLDANKNRYRPNGTLK